MCWAANLGHLLTAGLLALFLECFPVIIFNKFISRPHIPPSPYELMGSFETLLPKGRIQFFHT